MNAPYTRVYILRWVLQGIDKTIAYTHKGGYDDWMRAVADLFPRAKSFETNLVIIAKARYTRPYICITRMNAVFDNIL